MNRLPIGVQADAALKLELCQLERGGGDQFVFPDGYGVSVHRRLAVNGDSGRCLFRTGAAKKINADVVAHDAGEQTALGISPILRVARLAERRWLNAGPRWGPQWVHTGRLMQDLGDVAALTQDAH